MQHARSTKGFTLIEIMIVLVIIGAVLALAIPKLTNSKGKLKDEVKHIALLAKEVRYFTRHRLVEWQFPARKT